MRGLALKEKKDPEFFYRGFLYPLPAGSALLET
jgi:hypothetical protein